jgi:hypothetical protein
MKSSILTLLLLMTLALPAMAEVPHTMNIQGVLTDAAGNPVIDGDYNVNFLFYSSPDATTPIMTNDWDIEVDSGLFSLVMDMSSWLDPVWFENEIWLGLAIDGESEISPRIRLTSVPYAFRAAIADSVVGGGGSADSDWEIDGDDVHHVNGRVYVGAAPRSDGGERDQGRDDQPRSPVSNKMSVVGINEGLSGQMTVTDGQGGNRFGIYGLRDREGRSDGANFTNFGVGAAIGGYNSWGDSYTFGVSGHTYFDYPYTAGVLGADSNGNTWGALAYLDADSAPWGFFTPVNAHVGGTLEANGLRLLTGATAGYILTSDASGNASWEAPGASGADSDWEFSGEDIYRPNGRVYIGVAAGGARTDSEDRDAREGGSRDPYTSKLHVEGLNQGFYSSMTDIDGLNDNLAAVYGMRTRLDRNDGTGFGVSDVSGGTLGYNAWGDSYTFGVAGHTWFDYAYTAGVLGANHNGSLWAALAYNDEYYNVWGLYTPANIHVGGTTETNGLRLSPGASAGYILTSDASGNASWQAPGAASSDGDWIISGDDLIHAAPGTVAIGTDTAQTMVSSQTLLQVNATIWPALALDSEAGGFKRWAIINEGIGGELEFGYTTSPGTYPSIKMQLSDDGRLAVGNALSGAALSLGAGNGDLSVGNGDLYVGGSGYSFKLGVYTEGAQAGEVNLRADTSTGGGILDLGVDDHDILSLHDYQGDFMNSAGEIMVEIEAEDDMGDSSGSIKLYNASVSTATLHMDGGIGAGATIDMNQDSGLNGIHLDAEGTTYNGGELKIYNAAGSATLVLDGHYNSAGTSRITTDALEITGGADLSEQFDIGDGDSPVEPGMVVSIDPRRPGHLALCDRSYDRRVAGVISGAGGVRTGMLMGQSGSLADGELPVALAGRVYVWADASEGAIEPGDLLTTSDNPGHAMRVDDYSRAGGAILGKAMTGLSEGRGLVLVLVSLQ